MKKKTSENIWKLCFKVLTFAPAFENESSASWHSFKRNGAWFFFLFLFASLSTRETTGKEKREKKKKKNFWKYLEDILESSYLCIRFLKRTAIVKRAIFEQIYINNTSSTRARLFLINGELPWVKQENRQYLFYIGKDKLLNSSVLNR